MNTFESIGSEESLRLARAGEPRAPTAAPMSRIDELRAQPRKPGEASFFYVDHHFQYDAVKVIPGEYFVSGEDVLIMTVLGSCIAACVWDAAVRVGGMNRLMLPEREADAGPYGAYAMELMLNEMLKRGARRETMQARVFGGGAVMPRFVTTNLGARNTKFALDYLAAERIPVVSEDVLGMHPRKVCFFPITGKALVKRLAHTHSEALAVEERRGNAIHLAQATSGGSVELF